ncbi:hypothetical protein J4456_03320 [Candidatus Pacearchaeota archaeon]|nr:hypothetical protein [Candidatus Pacearchaeota archaeon]
MEYEEFKSLFVKNLEDKLNVGITDLPTFNENVRELYRRKPLEQLQSPINYYVTITK